MATIGQLNQQINALRKENEELQKEFDEYGKLKNELNNLIETHLQYQQHKRNALAGAGLQPSRCMNSFINKMNEQLDSSVDKTISIKISSLVDGAIHEQQRILRKIDNNQAQIRRNQRQIDQLKKAVDAVTD